LSWWMTLLIKKYGSSNLPRETQAPDFTDSEVLTVMLVGELCHAPREEAWLRQVRASAEGRRNSSLS
jgi:hypothetical protein